MTEPERPSTSKASPGRVVVPLGTVVAHVPPEVTAHHPGPIPPLVLRRAWFRIYRGAWELRFHGVDLDASP